MRSPGRARGAGEAEGAAQGPASARPQVSSGREGKGMPWCFGGAGTAYEGEQEA